MRWTCLILLAMAPTLSRAAENNPAVNDIVVTAIPLSQTKTALEACLSQGCPPLKDIQATLAHAENQFVAGDYKGARRTTEQAIDRNRRFGPTYPVEISELFRANANIEEHLGEAFAYRHAILAMRDTLKDHLPPDDPRAISAELEVGDSRFKMGYADEAKRKFREIEKQALDTGLPHVAAHARLRYLSSLVLEFQTDQNDPLKERTARREIARYIADPTPGAEHLTLIAELLQTRLDRATGRTDTTDAFIAKAVAQRGADRPALIFSPAIGQNAAVQARARQFVGSPLSRSLTSARDKWVDIGFWVDEAGRVEDAEVLRSDGSPGWADGVLRSVQGRRYVPAATGNGAPRRFFMIERYTLTAHWQLDSGSRMRTRSGIPRIERLDLTP